VAAHDLLDGIGGLVGMVEGDGADVVVEDVRLDDAVQERAANEAELAVDGGGGAASVGPGLGIVVGKRGVGVLEEGDGDYGWLVRVSLESNRCTVETYQASGSPRGTE
jgi:hypothetical protein